MRYNRLTVTLVLGGCVLAAAAQIEVQRPGTLGEQLDGMTLTAQGKLALKGTIDVRDLLTLKDKGEEIGVLDLSGTNIAEYNYAKAAHVGRTHFSRKVLPSYVFFRSAYKEVILPKDLTAIDAGAFAGSEITAIEIPEGVEIIGDYAFYGCPNLDFILLPSSVKVIGKGAFSGCPKLEEVDMMETKVTAIPENCFADSPALGLVSFPSGIESVGSFAFKGTSIDEIILPKVKVLDPYALADMPMLRNVTLNRNAKYNEGTLMNNGRLERVSGVPTNVPALFAANCYSFVPSDILAGKSEVGNYAFSNSSVSELILGKGLNHIGDGAFSGMTSLTDIDAQALKGDLPEVSENSFSGIEPSSVKLKVDKNSVDLWRNHPVWGQFNVQSNTLTGVDEIVADAQAGISIMLDGDMLKVTAPEPITGGGVFNIGGNALRYLPAGENVAEVSIEEISDNVLIVTVTTASERKTVKLMK